MKPLLMLPEFRDAHAYPLLYTFLGILTQRLATSKAPGAQGIPGHAARVGITGFAALPGRVPAKCQPTARHHKRGASARVCACTFVAAWRALILPLPQAGAPATS